LTKEVVGVKKVTKLRTTLPGEKQKQARVSWATKNKDMDIEFVVWTDETTFEALGPCAEQLILPGQQRRSLHTKQCPDKVMVWGAIGLSGKIFLKKLDKYVTSKTYCETLSEFLKELRHHFPVRKLVLQQDNARPHVASATTLWMKRQGVKVLEAWPPYSPDLNPIEEIWAWMKRKVREIGPSNRSDLEAAIDEVWEELLFRHPFLRSYIY
jgi:transposase